MNELFTAIYSRYTSDSDLSDNTTGMYFTEAPSNAVYPYIVFSLPSGVQDFDSDNVFEECIIQFNIYSDEDSANEVGTLFNYLKGSTIGGTGYDFFALEVDNYTTLTLKRESYNLLRAEKIWQYSVTYMCLLNYTGEVAVEKFYGNLFALMTI